MSDDLWIRELTQVNRESQDEERRRLDERWDRLSGGDLSPEEEAELRALAESSEEGLEAWEAFRPLGPDFHASVVQAIRDQGIAPDAAPAEPPMKLLPFRKRLSRLGGWGALAAAAVAAVVVLLARPAGPLPDYSLDVSGGSLVWRGEIPESARGPVFAPGDQVQLVLRPDTETTGKDLDAQCYLFRDADVRRLELRRTIDPETGAVKMEGSIGQDLQPGAWTLWAVVGRQGELPAPADLRSLSTGAGVRGSQWIAVPQEIRILSRGLPR